MKRRHYCVWYYHWLCCYGILMIVWYYLWRKFTTMLYQTTLTQALTMVDGILWCPYYEAYCCVNYQKMTCRISDMFITIDSIFRTVRYCRHVFYYNYWWHSVFGITMTMTTNATIWPVFQRRAAFPLLPIVFFYQKWLFKTLWKPRYIPLQFCIIMMKQWCIIILTNGNSDDLPSTILPMQWLWWWPFFCHYAILSVENLFSPAWVMTVRGILVSVPCVHCAYPTYPGRLCNSYTRGATHTTTLPSQCHSPITCLGLEPSLCPFPNLPACLCGDVSSVDGECLPMTPICIQLPARWSFWCTHYPATCHSLDYYRLPQDH